MHFPNQEELVSAVNKEAEKRIKNLHRIWDRIGYDPETINKFRNNVFRHTVDLWMDMESEAEDKGNEYIESAEQMKKSIATISRELKLDVTLPNFQTVPLLEIVINLKKKLKELEAIKESRMIEVRKLLEKEHQLCKSMGLTPNGFNSTVPSNEEVKAFEEYLSTKEVELLSLKNTFKDIRRSIIKMMEEISYTPATEFERLICRHDYYNSIVYSSINMDKLKTLHDEIKHQLLSMKEQADKCREELITLWTYLDVNTDVYEDYLAKYSGYDTSTISSLNKEIHRCKELRNENIANFVKKIREEISHWWDTCKLSLKEQQSFRYYTSEVYNEDILKLHEFELERLHRFYETNKEIFELLNKREEMWDQMKDYNRQTENPDRYHNRGGQLLAEEKMRKFLNKNLPKTEEHLLQIVTDYDNYHGKPFTIYGLQLSEYFAKQKDDHQVEMEKLKAAKLKAKSDNKSVKKTPLSASRRNLAGVSLRVANTSVKRKRSPLGGTLKMQRLANSENINSKGYSKIRKSGRLKVSRKLLSTPKRKTQSPLSPKLTNKSEASSNRSRHIEVSSSITSTRTMNQYEEFQEHLAARDELRSTLLLDFSEANKMKKPVKTPVKPSRKHFSPITPSRSRGKFVSTTDTLRSPRITSTPKFAAAPSTSTQNNF